MKIINRTLPPGFDEVANSKPSEINAILKNAEEPEKDAVLADAGEEMEMER